MKNKTRVLRALAMFAVCAGAGYFVGGVLGRFLKKGAPQGNPLEWWGLALVPLLMLAVLAFHEFGHVVGGWMSGFVTWLYAVGPLRLEREERGLVAKFNRDAALWGGIAAMAPPRGAQPDGAGMEARLLRVVAGGPLASLLLGLAIVPGLLGKFESKTLTFVFVMTGLVSLAIAIATLVPHRTGGFMSDGARIRQMLRGGDAARLWAAVATVGSLALAQRPRDWAAHLTAGLRGAGEQVDEVMARWLLHAHYMDRQEWDEADAALREALEKSCALAPALRSLVHASAAWHHALRRNAEAARAHLEQTASATFLKRGDRSAIGAAVLAAEGRRDEALRLAATAESQLRSRSDVQSELYRELLRDVRSLAASVEPA